MSLWKTLGWKDYSTLLEILQVLSTHQDKQMLNFERNFNSF